MQALQKRCSLDGDFHVRETVDPLSIITEHKNDCLKKTACSSQFRVLVIEDDPTLLEFYRHVLEGTRFSIDMSGDGHNALEKLSSKFYDLVITDLNLPGMDGINLLHWIQRHRPSTMAVVISGDASAEQILAAMREGAKDYLIKPFTISEFRKMLDRWSRSRRHRDREVFSSILKQVMHDVRNEALTLEITVKMLQRGKFGKTNNGVNGALQTMQSKLEQMKMLTTEYCLLSRTLLQRGGDIHTELINLKGDVITPVLQEMEDAMQRKEVSVSSRHDFSFKDNACVQGNRVMLKCVFRTLFNNAIKYCKEASVITYGITNNDRRFKIHVANEGKVVPAHMQASIFDEFVQVQPGTLTCEEKGLGLGLALAKDILQQHGGDIWYESIENGSKFVCTLPGCSTQSADIGAESII